MLTIRTNHVPRVTIDAFDLTLKERLEFDYIDWDGIDKGETLARFVRFKGQLYDLEQFVRCNHACGMADWDGYSADTAWSGVLVCFIGHSSERVLVGQYFS